MAGLVRYTKPRTNDVVPGLGEGRRVEATGRSGRSSRNHFLASTHPARESFPAHAAGHASAGLADGRNRRAGARSPHSSSRLPPIRAFCGVREGGCPTVRIVHANGDELNHFDPGAGGSDSARSCRRPPAEKEAPIGIPSSVLRACA